MYTDHNGDKVSLEIISDFAFKLVKSHILTYKEGESFSYLPKSILESIQYLVLWAEGVQLTKIDLVTHQET